MNRLLSIGLIFALAACGRGSDGNGLPSTGQHTGGGSNTQTVTVQFSVPKPAGSKAIARGRTYVSYSTNLAVVSYTQSGATFNEPVAGTSAPSNYVTDVSEATGSANSATPGKACVNATPGGPGRTCTLTLAIPTGLYSVELSLWSGAFTNAHTPQGDELSVSAHTPMTIAQGSSNSINFAVAGINAVVSSVYLLLDHSTVNWNTGSAVNLSIDLKDAEGNHIMSDGTGNGLVDPSGNTYTAHITLNTTQINGCTPSGTLADINGATPPYDVTAPPSGTVPVTQNDPCLYALTVTSSDPPNGTDSITNAPLQTSGVDQTYPSLTGISDAKATALDDKGRIWVFGTATTPGAGGIERLNADGSVTDYAAATGDIPQGGIEGTDGNMYIVNGDGNLTYLSVNAAAGSSPANLSISLPNPPTQPSPTIVAIARDSATGELWAVDSTYGVLFELANNSPAAPPSYWMTHAYSMSITAARSIDVQNGTIWIGDGSSNLYGRPAANPQGAGSTSCTISSVGAINGISNYDNANLLLAGTTGYAIVPSPCGAAVTGGSSQVAGAHATDGNLYFADTTAVQQVQYSGGTFKNGGSYDNEYPPLATFGNPTADLNGNLWFAVNGAGGVMEFTPPANWSAGGSFTINARHGHK